MRPDFLIEFKVAFAFIVLHALTMAALKYFGKYNGTWGDCFFFLIGFLVMMGAFLTVFVFAFGGKV